MKRIAAALLAAASVFLMVCCAPQSRKDRTAAAAVAAMLSALGRSEDCAVYRLDSLLAQPSGRAYFSSLYDGARLSGHLDAAEDFACAFSKREDGFEIEIFIAAHTSGTARLRELFERRLRCLHGVQTRAYLLQDYGRCIESAVIVEKGRAVALLSTEDNEKAERIFSDFFG